MSVSARSAKAKTAETAVGQMIGRFGIVRRYINQNRSYGISANLFLTNRYKPLIKAGNDYSGEL